MLVLYVVLSDFCSVLLFCYLRKMSNMGKKTILKKFYIVAFFNCVREVMYSGRRELLI